MGARNPATRGTPGKREMRPSSARMGRMLLALWTTTAAFLISPPAALVSLAFGAAAGDDGLGAGGAALAYNYVLGISAVLAFILGFAIRDVLHRRSARHTAARKPPSAPPRT